MSLLLRQIQRAAVASVSVIACAVACSTVTSGDGQSIDEPGPADAGVDQYVLDAWRPTDSGNDAPTGNDICGVGSCQPDDPDACEGYSPPAGDAGDGSVPSEAGTAPDGAADPDGGSADGGADGGAREAAADEGWMPSLSPPSRSGGSQKYACQVRSESGGAVRRCEVAGRGDRGAPCTASRDCAPGLACVGDQNAGQCLPFCCAGPEHCQALGVDGGGNGKSYCAERPLRDEQRAGVVSVPVCVPADNCSLDEAQTCGATGANACTCPENKTCALVAHRTTSCVTPGQGMLGEACPCAAGYHCLADMNTCAKVCKTDSNNAGECGTGRCQAAPNFPAGFGLCVGMAPVLAR